jgi:hypothetical protein
MLTEGFGFGSQQQFSLFFLRFFKVFSHFRKVAQYCLKLRHVPFFPLKYILFHHP